MTDTTPTQVTGYAGEAEDWEYVKAYIEELLTEVPDPKVAAFLNSRIALSQLSGVQPVAIPKAGEHITEYLIHQALAERDFPANTQNAARAGWEACRLYVKHAAASGEAVAQPVGAGWRPIESAPKDGTPVLLKFKDDKAAFPREDLHHWAGLQFVGVNRGNIMTWGFAAPVGMGGFPDSWFEGWLPLPPIAPVGEKKE